MATGDKNRIPGDTVATGSWTFTQAPVVPADSYGNREFEKGDPLEADKAEHQHEIGYAQESATTAADEARVLHVVHGATGTVVAFQAGCVAANIGDAKVEFDLLLNGVSILTAVVEVNVAHAAYEIVAGSIDTADLVVEDVLEVSINGTIGTGTLGTGAFCTLVIREDAE